MRRWTRIGAKALITCGHVGGVNHCQLAMRVAAEVFSIRYVCGFGADLPDGVVPFDDLFTAEKLDPVPPLDRERASNPAAHLAAITFDVGEGGVVPVARSHLQLLAGGLGVLLESRLVQDATMLSTLAPSSFAGICLTLLPWLLSGGKLLLHHPFDPPVLVGQWRGDDRCGALVVPGPVAFRLAEAGVFSRTGPACVLAPWRSPERLGTSPDWRERDTVLVDVSVFGEIGVVAARRGPVGRPAPIPFGGIVAPRGSPGAVVVAEVTATMHGTVALRGPMVPHHNFPPGAERCGLPHLAIGRAGLIDSGYTCRLDPGARTLVDHRRAARHRQCRRLPLPAARSAGHARPPRYRRDAGAPARSAARPAPDRQCGRSLRRAGRAQCRWRQPDRGRGLCRPQRRPRPAAAVRLGRALTRH